MVLLAELPAEIIQQIAFEVALTEQKQNQDPLALLFGRPRRAYLPVPHHLPALLQTCSRFHSLLNFQHNPAFYARLFRFHYDTLAIGRRFSALALQPHALAAEYRHRAIRIRHILQHRSRIHNHSHSHSHSHSHDNNDHLATLWTLYLLTIENDGSNVLVLKAVDTLQYLDDLASDPTLPLHQSTDDYPQDSAAHALALHIRNLLLQLPRLHSQTARERLNYQLRPFVFAAHKFDAFLAPWTYEHLPLGSVARDSFALQQQRSSSSPSSSSTQAQPHNPYLADLTPREQVHHVPYCGGVLRLAQPNPVLPACQLFFGLIEQDEDQDADEEDELPELNTESASNEVRDPVAEQHVSMPSSSREDELSENISNRAITANALHQALTKGGISIQQVLDAIQTAATSSPSPLASSSSSSSASTSQLPLSADGAAIAAAAVSTSTVLNNARFLSSTSSNASTDTDTDAEVTTALTVLLDTLAVRATDATGSTGLRPGSLGSLGLIAPLFDQLRARDDGTGTGDVWAVLAQVLSLLRDRSASSDRSDASASQVDQTGEHARNIDPTFTHLTSPTFSSSQAHDVDFQRLTACLSPFLSPGLSPLHFSTHFAGTWEGRFAFFDFDSYRDMLASGSVRPLMGEGQYGEQAQVWKLEEKVVKVRRSKAELERGRSSWRGGWVEGFGLEEGVEEEHEGEVGGTQDEDDDETEEVEEIAISGVGHSAWGHFVLKGRVRSWDGLVSLVKEYCPDGRGRWRYRGYLVAGERMDSLSNVLYAL
ncbi:unnamed protein product [Tilletia laevis]|uniref:Uncharacterized protein n=1 Tax=Tilletia laevis TaxID=157183 RepID=A0A9N8MGQ1_9BASI|nr:unnamed protein product [Tilletia laevis]